MAQIQNDPKESQKPAKVIEGMITGRIKKELKEICLLDQTYEKQRTENSPLLNT